MRETGTGQQVAQLHERLMMMMMMIRISYTGDYCSLLVLLVTANVNNERIKTSNFYA